ncbi:MAG: GGDEF domain-containing protein [Burkholderiaceae bacterium]
MLSFDIRTVMLFGAANTAICCITLLMSRSLHARSAPALVWGSAMHACATVALALFAWRGAVAPWLSVTFANSAFVLVWLCNLQAFRYLCEVRGTPVAAWALTLAGIAGFVAIGSDESGGAARVALFCVIEIAMALGVLKMLATRTNEEPQTVSVSAWLLHAAFVIMPAPRLIAGLGMIETQGGFSALNPVLLNLGNVMLIVAGPMIQAMILLGWTNSRLARELRRQAATDELTTLHSRRSFFDTVQERLRRPGPDERARALFMLDLDHFKQINDRHGHQVGDQVLRYFGELLRRSLSADDAAGRYGGEEFCAYVVREDRAQIEAMAEQLCTRVRHAPPIVNGSPIPLTVSIGIAHVTNDKALETLLGTADRHVYLAKATGRDRWVADGGDAFTQPAATATTATTAGTATTATTAGTAGTATTVATATTVMTAAVTAIVADARAAGSPEPAADVAPAASAAETRTVATT